MVKEKWHVGSMIVMVILSLLIAPVGVIAGTINLKHVERRKQAIILLILGLMGIALWVMHFSGHHH